MSSVKRRKIAMSEVRPIEEQPSVDSQESPLSKSCSLPSQKPQPGAVPWSSSPHLSSAILQAAQPFSVPPGFSLFDTTPESPGHEADFLAPTNRPSMNEEADQEMLDSEGLLPSEVNEEIQPLYKKLSSSLETIETNILTDFDFVRRKCVWRHSKSTSIPPAPRFGHTVSVINNKLFMIGGGDHNLFSDFLHVLNLRSLRWHTLSCAGPEPCPRANHSAVIIGDILAIWGGTGYGVDNAIYFLDTSSNSWYRFEGENAPQVRASHTMTYIGNKQLLLFGGERDGEFCEQMYIFDYSKMVWLPLTRPQPSSTPLLSGHASVLWNGDLYVFGGQGPNHQSEIHLFSLKSQSWSVISASSSSNQPDGGLCSHTWTLISKNVALLFGGWVTPQSTSEITSEKRPLNISQCSVSEKQVNGQIFAFDFTKKNWSPLNSVEPLRFSGNSAREVPPARFGHAVSLTPGGRLLLFGGRTSSSLSSGTSLSSSNDLWFLQLSLPPTPPPIQFKKSTATKLELYWTAQDCSVDSYRVERSKDGGKSWDSVYLGSAHNYVIQDLEPNTEFLFRLSAANQLGFSDPSKAVSKSTPSGSPPGRMEPIVFGRVFQRQILVRWDPPKDSGGHQIESYTLMQSSDGKEWTECYKGTETSFKASNLHADTRYWFRVAASNAFGTGKWTPIASVVTQPPRSQNPKKPLAPGERDMFQQRITELLRENEELKEKLHELETANRRLKSSCDFHHVPGKF